MFKNKDSIDSSSITNYHWKLNAFKTNIPIDLNNDGISSTDMTLEIDCLKNEILWFDNNNFEIETPNYYIFSQFTNNTNTPINATCNEQFSFYYIKFFGNFKMIKASDIKLIYTNSPQTIGFKLFEKKYTLTGDKLINVSEEMLPTIYNSSSQTWSTVTINVTREYIRFF